MLCRRARWHVGALTGLVQFAAEFIGQVSGRRRVGQLIAQVRVLVIRVVQQAVVQVADAVAQQMQAAIQGGDGLGGLWVADDDPELLADGAKLPGVQQDADGVVVVGWLGKHDGPTPVVVNPCGGQFVVCDAGHVGVFQWIRAGWMPISPVNRRAGIGVSRR